MREVEKIEKKEVWTKVDRDLMNGKGRKEGK